MKESRDGIDFFPFAITHSHDRHTDFDRQRRNLARMTTFKSRRLPILRSVAVQATRIHHVHLLPPSSFPHEARSNRAPTLRLRLQRQWRANVNVILTLGLMCCLATTVTAISHNTETPSDLYIALVSIPVLDKVLPLMHLAEALLSRGVRVGFALPENCRPWVRDLKGLEFISLNDIVGKGRAVEQSLKAFESLGVYESYANSLRYYASFQRPMYRALLATFAVDQPDLVVVDRYTFAGFDICHRLQLPYVINNPHLLLDMDAPPASISAPFSNYVMHTTSVLERCLNSIYRLRFRLEIVRIYHEIHAVRHEVGLERSNYNYQLPGHVLVLVNSVFGLDEARPLVPQFLMVGLLQSESLQREHLLATSTTVGHSKLPVALSAWLHTSEDLDKPLVFISSPLNEFLTPKFILNVLKTGNARILWRLAPKEQEAMGLVSLPYNNVMIIDDRLDDATVLALVPEIALLITAGDFSTIQEALVAGVPILGLPHSAEQFEGVNAVVRAGAGLRLKAKDGESTWSDAIHKILVTESTHFKANAKSLGKRVKIGGGVERAVTELLIVAELGGHHLVPMPDLQPLYKTYLVDVVLIYAAIFCGAAIILRTTILVFLSIL
ncbi:hypothetical protein CCR75_003710 [Bremia lactucae]|uniref:Uncharacterized protein n=1 Tax=Bremia lactucae TaxID=4779 RepID=A0A976IKI8_BRELC|nr:hypothetical protein CCR75_003710 [Bremia lactucae]